MEKVKRVGMGRIDLVFVTWEFWGENICEKNIIDLRGFKFSVKCEIRRKGWGWWYVFSIRRNK